MNKPYELEFELMGLPKMSNQLLGGHWTIRASHAKKWKRAVWAACWHLRPPLPLKKAMITLTRFSSQEPDFDGLTSGFKSPIDGLVEAKIIENDTVSIIGQPIYIYMKVPPGSGKIAIAVKEIIG